MADSQVAPEFEAISLLCLPQSNPIRKALIKVVRCRWFERLVILIILCNCIMLALYDPLDRGCTTRSCKNLEAMEAFIFSFFALEMVIKMVAMGVFGKKAYFSDHWNILDLCIVIAGIVDRVGLRGDFLTIARLGRVLRPLRAINRVPSIRILVTLLIDTIPMLGNVLLLAFLVFSLFGIVGLQVWQGKLRNRCYVADETWQAYSGSLNISAYYQSDDGTDTLCSLTEDFGIMKCSDVTPTVMNGKECSMLPSLNATTTTSTTNSSCVNWNALYTVCRPSDRNPFHDSVSFDNVGMSWIFIYQVVTLEGWSELMYFVQDVSSYWTWIYFVALITIGSFFLVNLSLVVITMQFSETKKREMKLIKAQRKTNHTSSNLSLVSDMRLLRDYVILRLRCCKQAHVHHFHHHEHHHFHHFSYQCEKCKMFCGFQMGSISPPAVPRDRRVVIPELKISCAEAAEVKACQRFLANKDEIKLAVNCDETTTTALLSPKHGLGTNNNSNNNNETTLALMSDDDATHSVFLLSPTCSRSSAQGSKANTLSIHAESVASIHVDPRSSIPTKATSQTAISVTMNGSPLLNQTSINTTAIQVGCHGNISKTTARTATTITCVTPDVASRDRSAVQPSAPSTPVSSSKFDTLSDFGDTGSEMLYGSMFDVKNADTYYVSEEPSYTTRFRMNCKRISESRQFSYFIMVFIVLNTVCMGMEHHNQPKKMTEVLESMNLVFIWIFTLEMFIKLLGVGLRGYFTNGFNVFDCVIVFLSIVELLAEQGNGGSSFIVLRSIRLLRIFKLVRPMRHQLIVMVKTMSSVMTFFTLLFLFMFTFAILGMNIFGGKFGNLSESRSNFDTFLWAMVTVFQVLTQEDWNLVMYSSMRATGKASALYFIALMTIGYYVLLNLLVAILVEGFTTPMEKRRMARRLAEMLIEKTQKTMEEEDTVRRSHSMPDIETASKAEAKAAKLDEPKRSASMDAARKRRITVANAIDTAKDEDETVEGTKRRRKKSVPVLTSARRRQLNDETPRRDVYWEEQGEGSSDKFKILPIEYEVGTDAEGHCIWRFLSRRKKWSLFVFSDKNRFRVGLVNFITNRWFDYGVLVLILFSCVLLAMETPNRTMDSKKKKFMDVATFVTTWVFTIEMLLKILAYGLLLGRGAYLKNGWNILDGLLVVLSWVDILVTLANSGNSRTDIFKALRVLRALRTLRPLRMIQRAPGLKIVVQTLLYSLKPIGNTVLIAGIFFVVFGILGVQMLKGKFYSCSGADVPIQTKAECLLLKNAKWTNYQYNFDNLPQALVSLFVISTKDGWVDIMQHGIDAKEVDAQPQINYAPWRIGYFISFLLIGGFLVLNMIVGIVVENFQRCRELQGNKDKAKKVFERWKECVEERKMKQLEQKYIDNNSRIRLFVFKVCTHTYWVVGVTGLILLNTVCMAIEYYGMPQELIDFAEIGNIVFTCLYTLEAGLQITAFGWRKYLKTKWYVFDVVIVIFSIIGIIIENVQAQKLWFNPALIRAMRMLRVVRVLKLLKIAKGLRFLLDHVAETVPQVTNLALLFLLLFFIYSCLGMQLFGGIVCDTKTPCAGLGRHANFHDMGHSMLTLFRVATGDNWSGILKDTLRTECDSSLECTQNCCISRYTAPLFFVTFVLFAQFVLVNIVIAVLMKHLRVNNLCVGNQLSPAFVRNSAATKQKIAVKQTQAGLKSWHARAKMRIAKADTERQQEEAANDGTTTDRKVCSDEELNRCRQNSILVDVRRASEESNLLASKRGRRSSTISCDPLMIPKWSSDGEVFHDDVKGNPSLNENDHQVMRLSSSCNDLAKSLDSEFKKRFNKKRGCVQANRLCDSASFDNNVHLISLGDETGSGDSNNEAKYRDNLYQSSLDWSMNDLSADVGDIQRSSQFEINSILNDGPTPRPHIRNDIALSDLGMDTVASSNEEVSTLDGVPNILNTITQSTSDANENLEQLIQDCGFTITQV